MANVSEYVAAIRKAIYGEEVRGSIASAIEAMNKDNEDASTSAKAYAKAASDSATDAANSAAVAATEVQNAKAEANRSRDEADRAATEVDNAKAEADRAKDEADRAATEVNNAKAEVQNAKNEADRSAAEVQNAKNEADRATTEAEAAEEYAELARQMGHGSKMFSVSFTLPMTGWVKTDGLYYQTANITGLEADSVGIVGLSITVTQAIRDMIGKYGIALVEQGSGYLIFTSKKRPEIDIPLVVNF